MRDVYLVRQRLKAEGLVETLCVFIKFDAVRTVDTLHITQLQGTILNPCFMDDRVGMFAVS